MSLKETDANKVAAVVKKMIKETVLTAVGDGKVPRLSVKTNKLADWLYYIGYDDKVRAHANVVHPSMFPLHSPPSCYCESSTFNLS